MGTGWILAIVFGVLLVTLLTCWGVMCAVAPCFEGWRMKRMADKMIGM